MKSPIINDPFVMVAQAFENVYPDKKYMAWVYPEFEKEFGEGYGVTNFYEDDSTPDIYLNADAPYYVLIEIFAHELAHVAVGVGEEHGEQWESAFDAIFQEFNRLLEQKYAEES